MYDYLIVGSGLFGSVCAWRLKQQNKKVLIIEQRNHIGGNIYTKNQDGIIVHKYGAHIFHTSNKKVWDFVNSFSPFEQFNNQPIANYNNHFYNLPFNMHTFYQIYGIKSINELNDNLKKWNESIENPSNLEEFAIKNIGKKAYEILIKGYTEKQWGTTCNNLPIDILSRIPIKKEWNNNYFDDLYQGIPIYGYTHIIEKMIDGVDIILNEKFNLQKHNKLANKIIYCGSIDELYNYQYGELQYRSLTFKEIIGNSIGIPVMNFTSSDIPYTRIIDHKMFLNKTKSINHSILTYEFPEQYKYGLIPYYPIPNKQNNELYNKYLDLNKNSNIILGGRLGLYKYLNMDKIIEIALNLDL